MVSRSVHSKSWGSVVAPMAVGSIGISTPFVVWFGRYPGGFNVDRADGRPPAPTGQFATASHLVDVGPARGDHGSHALCRYRRYRVYWPPRRVPASGLPARRAGVGTGPPGVADPIRAAGPSPGGAG